MTFSKPTIEFASHDPFGVGARCMAFNSRVYINDVDTPRSVTMQPATVVLRRVVEDGDQNGMRLADVQFDGDPRVSTGHFVECLELPRDVPRAQAKPQLDERDVEVVRGLLQALAGYTFATPELIARHLTGVLWSAREVAVLYPEPQAAAATQDPVGTIPGIGFAVSNDGGKTCVAYRDNVHAALDYLKLQNVNGGNYAVVVVKR